LDFGRLHAVEIAADLWAEDVMQVPVLQHRARHAGGDPHELLELLDLGRGRHALGRGVKAHHQIDLLLLDQACRLVDGDIRLALGIGVDRLDLIAFDAALLDEVVEHDLGAVVLQLGATARERASQVIDDADLDLLRLGLGGSRQTQSRKRSHEGEDKAPNNPLGHDVSPRNSA
jgi:hypothetical protein